MKKLKLSKVNFAGAEVLTREQLKKVIGGMGSDEDDCGLPGNCRNLHQCLIKSGPHYGQFGRCNAAAACTCQFEY